MKYAVAMRPLGVSGAPPRVCLVSHEGCVLVVDIEGICAISPGSWTVVADVEPLAAFGASGPHDRLSVYSCQKRDVSGGAASSSSSASEDREHHQRVPLPFSGPMSVDTCKDFVTFVGMDGALRLMDSEMAVGSGRGVGKVLRARGSRNDTWIDTDHHHDGGAATGAANGVSTQFIPSSSLSSKDRHKSAATSTPSLSLSSSGAAAGVPLRSVRRRSASASGRGSRSTMRNKLSAAQTSSSAANSSSNWADDSSGAGARVGGGDDELLRPVPKPVEDPMPLFELAGLSPKERQVNEKKLRVFLQQNGKLRGHA